MTRIFRHPRRPPDRPKKGMTLLELIVVIVILGMLAAIAIPTFAGVLSQSKVAATEETLHEVHTEAAALCLPGPITQACTASAVADLPASAAAGTGTFAAGPSWTLEWGQSARQMNQIGAVVAPDGDLGLSALARPSLAVYLQASASSLRSGTLRPPWTAACASANPTVAATAALASCSSVTATLTLPILAIFAGTGTAGAPTPGRATSSDLNSPFGVAVGPHGSVYIADAGNEVVEKVSTAGTLSIFAGTGTGGTPTPGPATSSDLSDPSGVAVGPHGSVYIADFGNNVVEKVNSSGQLSIFAGTGTNGTPTPGPATSSDLNAPGAVAVGPHGNVYIADEQNSVNGDAAGNQVLKVTPTGTLSIFAGTGTAGKPTPGPATSSDLSDPYGVAVGPHGSVYIADMSNSVVEKVSTAGTLSIFAGTGAIGTPTPGPATSSDLGLPRGVVVDPATGNVFIAAGWPSQVVEKVTPSGTLSIFAGTGTAGTTTPGPATSSDLNFPSGVAVGPHGNLYIVDGNNNVVAKVTP